jgi:hypothetical protein
MPAFTREKLKSNEAYPYKLVAARMSMMLLMLFVY